mmetsp:Transcript_48406/g.78836  ORF Transcript_48406/g.78836 Transcript_48406/m.78836 type:complete len:82 (-) Transcript_48406:164-409(-)
MYQCSVKGRGFTFSGPPPVNYVTSAKQVPKEMHARYTNQAKNTYVAHSTTRTLTQYCNMPRATLHPEMYTNTCTATALKPL